MSDEGSKKSTKNSAVLLWMRLKSPHKYIAAAILAILLFVFGWWLYSELTVIDYRSTPENLQRKYDEFKKNESPANKSKDEQVKYYEDLANKAAMAEDYPAAIEAFRSRQRILGQEFPAGGFMGLATYYCKMDDKVKAMAALEEGIKRPNADESDKQLLGDALQSITTKGCTVWLQPLDLE